MAQEEYGLSPEDIGMDEQGRIIITNPQVAERLRAAAARAKPKPKNGPNTNCHGCTPQNVTPNCGCVSPQT